MINIERVKETFQQFFNPSLWFANKLLELRDQEIAFYESLTERYKERVLGLVDLTKTHEKLQEQYKITISCHEALARQRNLRTVSLLVKLNYVSQEVYDYVNKLKDTGTLLIRVKLLPVNDAEDLRVNERTKQRVFELLGNQFGTLEDLPSSEFIKVTGTQEKLIDLLLLFPEFDQYYSVILDREIRPV
jgi:hypothetical protein